jgi:hypothetical protein
MPSSKRTDSYFTERAARADIGKALDVPKRAGVGQPPVKGDELPPVRGWQRPESGSE